MSRPIHQGFEALEPRRTAVRVPFEREFDRNSIRPYTNGCVRGRGGESMGEKIADQHRKFELLKSLRGWTGPDIHEFLGITKGSYSPFAGSTANAAVPSHHAEKLAAEFGFSTTWSEWREGSAEEFRQRLEAETRKPARAGDDPEALAAQIETAYRQKIEVAGHNRQPILREMLERALGSILGNPEFCDGLSEETVAREIVRLEMAFRDLETDSAKLVTIVISENLRKMIDALRRKCGGVLKPGEIHGELEALLEAAREEAVRLLAGDLERGCRVALEGLKMTLADALGGGTLDLGWLSDEVSHVERLERQLYRKGARNLRYAVGMRLDKVPRPAIFTDGTEDWLPEMVALPTGAFLMGSPADEEGHHDREGPQHEVAITERFALARYPVTFEEYDAFCDATGRQKPKDKGWGRGRRPAVRVSWEDARAYCDWLSAETGVAYRLPSEAEWEYACRAETTTRYWWGDDWDVGRANAEGKIDKTTEVGAYDPNRWHLHDTHGNVWEWCEDQRQGDYAQPRSQAAFQSRSGVSDRVIRGGSWSGNARGCRAAFRSFRLPDYRDSILGFRPARGSGATAQPGNRSGGAISAPDAGGLGPEAGDIGGED